MDRASQIIFDKYIEPTKSRNYEYTGMEFECPIYSKDTSVSLRQLGSNFLAYIIEEKGFKLEAKGYDGYLVKAKYDGDTVSYDVHYNVIEFSIKPCKTLIEIKERYNRYLAIAQEYYMSHNCEIVGFGNYYPYKAYGELDNSFPKSLLPEFTNDDFYAMVQEFFDKSVGFADGLKYIINMCSTQIHLDVPFDEYIETFNLLNELTFVRGTLFSNSPWLSADGMYYCSRDNAWKGSKVFNTGIFDKHFESVEELCEEMSKELAMFSVDENGKPIYVKAVPLKKYFNEMGKGPEELNYFRCFKNIIPNNYCCVEIREDCTQPFSDSMVTGAFNLGMALGHKKAAECMSVFKEKAGITDVPNSVLRLQSITGKLDIDENLLKSFFTELYNIAYNELEKRGHKEEVLLLPLKPRIDSLKCPAMAYLESLESLH